MPPKPPWVFNTCCGCIELRTGCLVIVYLNLIKLIFFIALEIVGLVIQGVLAANGKDEETNDTGELIFTLLVFFFCLAFTIVVLVGIHKNKRGHVQAYMIASAIELALSLISTLSEIFAGKFDAETGAIRIIADIISVCFLLVIRSYYYKMDDKRPAVYNTA